MLPLTLFSNPDWLCPVGRFLLATFLHRFREDLALCNVYLPNPESRTPHYFTQVVMMLQSPAHWPDTFEQALREVEQIARSTAAAPPAHAPQNAGPGKSPPIEEAGQPPAPLRAAIELWLNTHPTDDPTEVPRAVEADRLRREEDQLAATREAELRDQPLRAAGLVPETDTRELALPEGSGHQPSNPPPSTILGPILPSVKIDGYSTLAEYFMPHQIAWIFGEDELHGRDKPAFALAEKSVRIGWTYCDAFKNVRKRLRFRNRDYLFATKDYPSALEYMTQAYEFAELLNFTRAVVAHGEEYMKIQQLDPAGRPTHFTEEVKYSYIKFDNKSRLLAFSASPQAMAVYGGDVGLDEFAKHPNAQLLWQTAQGRVTWGYDLAVWSSHEGEDTLFNQFAQQARAGRGPWNLYYRVTIADAIELGLLDVINRLRGTALTPEQFIADCRARAGLEEIFQQTYMCNPVPGAAGIVEWSAIERCRSDYAIERVHLEAEQVRRQFGQFSSASESERERRIANFLRRSFPNLFNAQPSTGNSQPRLGFDVAASGEGDLAVCYIDEARGAELWLRALLTVRTEDWHFLKTVLFYFLKHLPRLQAAGDETGLGRQICWEAAKAFSNRFLGVNFASKKHDLGFSLMNQLSVAEKRFPRSEQDIAADYFALRKSYTGTKWVFREGRNSYNPASHCDIAWAGALASAAHQHRRSGISAAVLLENGTILYSDGETERQSNLNRMILSDDPRIWRPLNY